MNSWSRFRPPQSTAATGFGFSLEGGGEAESEKVRQHLATLLGVPPIAIGTATLAHLPMTSSGKKDYRALA